MNLLDRWLENMRLKDDMAKAMTLGRDNGIFKPHIDYESLESGYREILRFENRKHISFGKTATEIIQKLFERYVDDDTLVITTRSEHPSVVEQLDKCKNVLRITQDYMLDNRIDIKREIGKYEKIFVYVIGLSMGNDYRTPDYLIEYLRGLTNGKKVKFVLDAVQEMFLLPRDYSRYDYVIGTAHALIPNFNMGIVISEEYFDKDLRNGYDLLVMVQELGKRYSTILQFNYVMTDYFSKYLMTDESLSKTSNCPYIFTLKDKKNRLWGIQEIIGEKPSSSIVTFRACNDFLNIEKFKDKLRRVENVLENS